jgi:hypothetical protein
MKHKACKVPLSMIQNSPIPLTEIVSLRDQLKRVREVLSAHESSEEST